MRLLVILALANVALGGHIAVRMPYLNPAGVTYSSYGHHHQAAPIDYDYGHQEQQVHYGQAPVAVGYAQVPVKAAVAVPTVHHVPAVADVPYTKYEAQPAVIQKLVDVAKPAIKTRKYEIRRPAIQKQFYDIEERVIVRPVGSALVELDEPLSKAQKGPAIVSDIHPQHHHEPIAVAVAPAQHLAVTPTVHTVAITPAPHAVALDHHQHHYAESPKAYYHEEPIVAVTPKALYHEEPILAVTPKALIDTPYLHKRVHHEHVAVSTTPHYIPEPYIVSSTPIPEIVEARNAAVEHAAHAAHQVKLAHEEAAARAYYNNHHHDVAPARSLNHLSHEEAQENQQRLIKLLTANGGVAEVGFGRDGHSEHVGDAGISRARVLSATPSPYHPPVDEKVKTRRIVVSRPVQTLQEIDVVEPATKLERVAINQPTVIKTARVGVERVHTSVPVYGKALAPAVAHAQVPVSYYKK